MANCRRSSADSLLSSSTDSLNRSEETHNTYITVGYMAVR